MNDAPQPICAFLEVVLREDTSTWREPPPAANERTKECRALGITGLVMRRDPWWDTVPPREGPRGDTRQAGRHTACDETHGEIG